MTIHDQIRRSVTVISRALSSPSERFSPEPWWREMPRRPSTRLNQAETIIQILSLRLGALDPALGERIRGLPDKQLLTTWYEAALRVVDAEGAQRLVETIRKAPLP